MHFLGTLFVFFLATLITLIKATSLNESLIGNDHVIISSSDGIDILGQYVQTCASLLRPFVKNADQKDLGKDAKKIVDYIMKEDVDALDSKKNSNIASSLNFPFNDLSFEKTWQSILYQLEGSDGLPSKRILKIGFEDDLKDINNGFIVIADSKMCFSIFISLW